MLLHLKFVVVGKLPAARASPEIVAAFRNEERQEMDKLLSTYLMTCTISRVYFIYYSIAVLMRNW